MADNPMKKDDIEIEILGSKWLIKFVDDDPAFEEAEGYCEGNERIITIQNVKLVGKDEDPLAIGGYAQCLNQKRVLRHEIIHAYLMESGLDSSALPVDNWAANEEMVDWFARQSPKIFKTFKELKLL